ncbi:restriction endonuclease subunit S [Qipengyuania sp. 6B39]|uniref:restriction endonuclease subunit S n=1 Tax=Qipengyuania proteolytica TaxID=2867239 RepID=UPI001C893D83|nr:restriction endonuclease subunit S [Qipengyuania proteolytica]MBX7494259.1 restriction endonuclease subunit S [Qipengyuania proteolytica]
MARANTQTGGRDATNAIIPGDRCISVGDPGLPAAPGWSWKRLSSLARLESGHTPSRRVSEYWGGDVPWLGIKDATGNHGREIFETNEYTNALGIANSSARICPAGTVCLSRTASVGYVIKMGRPMATSQDFVNWVCSDELNPDFLKYALLSETRALRMFAVGSVHPTIYFPEVKAFHICLPSRDVQDAIADTLAALDDKIEVNRRINETLEAQARALFRDWFVDFGPVKAKMAGDAPYLAPDLWSLFPNGLKDGVPEGWKTGVLSDLLVLQRGFDLPKTKRTDGPYPVIAASGPSGTHNESRVEGPGVCTGRSGVLGGVYYVEGDFWPLNTSLWIKAYPNSTPLHAMFTLQEIDIAAFNAGSAVPTLNRNHIHQAPAAIPPMNVVEAFTSLASVCYAKISANEREGRTLVRVRDLLLPKLMSGEIRVGDVASEELSAA